MSKNFFVVTVFVPGKPLKPSLIFAIKALAYQSGSLYIAIIKGVVGS
jgi:hypothetical protein